MRSLEVEGQNYQTDTSLLYALLNRKPSSCEPRSCCLVLCGLGVRVRVSPHRALGAPSPRCTWWRPRYVQKIWSGPVLPPPKFPSVAMESCLKRADTYHGRSRPKSATRADTRAETGPHPPGAAPPGSSTAILRLNRFTFCVQMRCSSRQTHLSEGDGHH
jgi:hypothetical protein